jgi:ribulose-phosphate 3-epimerase
MKETIYIEPSMIAADWSRMGEEAKSCFDAGIEILHLDVMDGHFVPNLTMGPALVAAIRRAVPKMILDVHLMIYNPDDYVERFIQAGADEITFHLEATEEVEHVLNYIRVAGKKAGLAIKPETTETLLLKYLDKADKFLIMTVEPGFGGQEFLPDMLDKVRFLRENATKLGIEIDIQVDGGINFDTGRKSIEAGANRLVTGTHFFKQKDLAKAVVQYNELRTIGKLKK